MSEAQKESLTNLDFLRALAVTFVLVDHTFNEVLTLSPAHHTQLSWLGRLGVLFFFVHTCCVLMMSLERHKGTRLFSKFYARRIFRIYPLSIVAVLIVAAVHRNPAIHGPVLVSNLALIQNLTFSPVAFGSMWSLPLEVQMYLFLPFIFLLVVRFPKLWIPLSLFAISVPVALWQPAHVARANVLAYAPDFLPGVIAYVLFRGRHALIPAWVFPVGLLLCTVAFLSSPGWQTPAWIVCFCVGVALPFFRQIASTSVNSVTFLLAKYSYGIYVSHSLLLLYMRPSWRTLPVYLGLVLVCSVAAYHLLEHPMIKLGYRMTQQKNASASRLAA